LNIEDNGNINWFNKQAASYTDLSLWQFHDYFSKIEFFLHWYPLSLQSNC